MVAPIDITFLGTGSAQPSSTRNHQAIALRLNGDIWLFDCGEATQHQFQKSKLKMGKITHVFITHMHGDHCFGLAPLLCSMTDNLNPNKDETKQDERPIEIYGPRPLRSWLRQTLKSTYANLGRRYRVHELVDEGEPRDETSDFHPDELEGHTIWAVDGRFETLPCCEPYEVRAASIEHSIPSLGYVVREPDHPGKLDRLVPLLKAQSAALIRQGVQQPMRILGEIQKTNQAYVLPNGQVLQPPAMRPGRQIVLLGDTCDPSRLAPLCHQPTLLVHEATNALTRLDPAESTMAAIEARTKDHGHSTPQMAATFAKRIGCKTLILTHFSARYPGDEQPESLAIMEDIRRWAVQTLDGRDGDVYCARDLWSFEIKMDSPLGYDETQ
ncbi:hypothetical protein G6F61_000114 [Rhizopus arrhizus]|nr:hypothetical protein G6F61_000114 [Rhizopus arrhizus]